MPRKLSIDPETIIPMDKCAPSPLPVHASPHTADAAPGPPRRPRERTSTCSSSARATSCSAATRARGTTPSASSSASPFLPYRYMRR
ncbi:hypothetical protein CALCODRAFT_496711 [Calocera cornea HHB12733]|uniref:Uncharacterized protein n=1 Tax=Calocera cornea HHB12733 TaxID=1353952 RepID=A0A165FPT7_9BASI|nr:hypothetical protein CALCODRAFT_496711 [Calocera cornea HHB12733]